MQLLCLKRSVSEISKFIRKGKTRERTVRAEDIGEQFKYKTDSVESSTNIAMPAVHLVLVFVAFCAIL